MINEVKRQAELKMKKSIEALETAFHKIRTGRAHTSLLDTIKVSYYGADMPLNQVANVSVEDARTLQVTPWEKSMVIEVEKAIRNSDLGLNPISAGQVIRVPLPALNEETRKNFIKKSKAEAENARVAVRNIRRDANHELKTLLNDKKITEDEERKTQDEIQKLTDKYVANIDQLLGLKEKDLLEI